MLASILAPYITYWKTTVGIAIATPAIAVAWPYWEPYFPAHRDYVIQAGSDTRKGLNELILQGVNQHRDNLRREQFDTEQKIKNKPSDFDSRKRLNEVNESLGEVEKKRERLLRSLETK